MGVSKKKTPMMRQYSNLKQQYKDKVLLFRMGDFYETFGDDAKITSRVLNIALTTRDKSSDPTPLAGFPHHALNQYLPKLVRAGYNVAIADQVEDPKLAKGIVKREITRVVTPGTLTDEKDDKSIKNNYLISIFKRKNVYGLAISDLATGEFKLTDISGFKRLREEVNRLRPAEIVVPPNQDYSELSTFPIQINDIFDFTDNSAKQILCKQLNIKNLNSYGVSRQKVCIIAAGSLIEYLKQTQKTELSHINSIEYYDSEGNMVLDPATISNLNLVSNAGEFGHKSTLFSVLNKCITSMGSRKLYYWILHPLMDLKDIKYRQEFVDYFFVNPDKLEAIQNNLKNISDLERVSGKIGLDRANGRDLINLAESVNESIKLISILEDSELKTVSEYLNRLKDLKPKLLKLYGYINESIVENPPNTITEGNLIKDGKSKKIDEIRHNTKDSKIWIRDLEKDEKTRTGITSLKVKSNKVFGYYIEVTNTHKDKVPDNYIRKQTLVNAERYITKELKEKESIVLNAEERLAKLEYEEFQKVRNEIVGYLKNIQELAKIISDIDCYSSLAYIARINDYCQPTLFQRGDEDGILLIQNGRHPIVEVHSEEEFISNDINLDCKERRLAILTGPNMSGKSTYIRQIALIVLMAQIGSFVPAREAKISITDRIFTRVGASDDLSAGRSTFMVEMDEAANIINNATSDSFIVLDEIGRGTSTYDGVSIAWAISEYIHTNIKARCLFATHYHELLKLESELNAVKNLNVSVVEDQDNIIFLRKIEEGGTDRSYGIHVAQMAGLPQNLIDRAKAILNGFEQENMFGVRSNNPEEMDTKDESKKEEQNKNAPQEENSENQNQLSFMGNNSTYPNIFDEIKKIDVNNTTPIEALDIISKWKDRLK